MAFASLYVVPVLASPDRRPSILAFGRPAGSHVYDNPNLIARFFSFVPDGVQDLVAPPLSEVLASLRTLNGTDIDTAAVTLHNGDTMDIGGGNGRLICHARTNGRFLHLANPSCPLDETDLVSISMNEEINTYPRCYIVPLEMVERAVEYFCRTGSLNHELLWDDTLTFEPL